jgi:hypothetical protein
MNRTAGNIVRAVREPAVARGDNPPSIYPHTIFRQFSASDVEGGYLLEGV